MKTTIMKSMNNQQNKTKTHETQMDENRLYHLVFTGKISLKEYLLAIRRKEAEKQAA